MNIQDLLDAGKKPELYTPGTAVMWTDPHISKQLLATHLSQDSGLASRKIPDIEATLDWMMNRLPNGPLEILDLGCGPGLYTERLAQKGHGVTGMDISAGSLDHARASAAEKGLDVTYLEQDYLTLDHEEKYDLVMMIFMDFGVLRPDHQAALLGRVFRALKPGGSFIVDMLNTNWRPGPPDLRSWDAREKGFWRPHPYLALSRTFAYENRTVWLFQHLVADEQGTEIYRFYTHTFSHGRLKTLMANHGFTGVTCEDGLLPDGENYKSSDVTFCHAVK